MKKLISLALAGCMVCSLAACGSSSSASEPASSAAAGETLTGKGQGFGGVITATVTVDGDTITGVTFDGPDETPDVGGAALETIAQQMVDAGSAEVDGVSGATYTTEGCIAAVQNAMDPEGHPFEEADAETTEWPTGDEPVEIPSDRKIVSASTYGMYTKSPDSDQDAVIGATLYWDLDNDECYAIRFTEPVTPFMDTGATSGWACVQDADVLAALATMWCTCPSLPPSTATQWRLITPSTSRSVMWCGPARPAAPPAAMWLWCTLPTSTARCDPVRLLLHRRGRQVVRGGHGRSARLPADHPRGGHL